MVQSELHIRGNISFASAKVQTNFFVRMETFLCSHTSDSLVVLREKIFC